MEPSRKSPGMANFLEAIMGRSIAIENNRCIPAPAGCGRDVSTVLNDWTTPELEEYTISGMCADCQRKVRDLSEEKAYFGVDILSEYVRREVE